MYIHGKNIHKIINSKCTAIAISCMMILAIMLQYICTGISDIHTNVISFKNGYRSELMHGVLSAAEQDIQTMAAEGMDLYARNAVLIDGDTGAVLYDKNCGEHRPNASTTKILTCIIALECGNLGDKVTVSSYAAKMPEVRLGAREGEVYSLEDMLYAMMLESYNDAAVVIAEHIGGTVQGFADMMNKKAREIGCLNTYFITPNGLDAQDDVGVHGTSAEDLARIMRYCVLVSPCLKQFLKITQTNSYTFRDDTGQRVFTCVNHNAFLNMMDGAVSGKTGFTCDAGYCYVGAGTQNGHTYIWALLGCGWPNNKTYKWKDSRKLMAYAGENISYSDIAITDTPDVNLVYSSVSAGSDQTNTMCDSIFRYASAGADIHYIFNTIEEVKAPIYAGEIVGYIEIYDGEKLIDIEPICIGDSVGDVTLRDEIIRIIKQAMM